MLDRESVVMEDDAEPEMHTTPLPYARAQSHTPIHGTAWARGSPLLDYTPQHLSKKAKCSSPLPPTFMLVSGLRCNLLHASNIP